MRTPYPLSLDAYGAADEDSKNRMLLQWLSDDQTRPALFRLINEKGGMLPFPSRDATPREPEGSGYDLPPRRSAVWQHMPVTLVTKRELIEDILVNASNTYSSRVYAELGGGSFMLALDPKSSTEYQEKNPQCPSVHRRQRNAFAACFPGASDQRTLLELAHRACEAAAIMALRGPDFDLADFAQQSAVRYCQMLMGYAFQDYPLLEKTLNVAYQGLVHQVFERHFVTDPTVIPGAKALMGRLLARTAALIDAYHDEDKDELKGTMDPSRPHGFIPVLKKLADYRTVPGAAQPSACRGELNAEQRATIAVGAAIGSVGNVQASVCIAVEGLFATEKLREQARTLARCPLSGLPTTKFPQWKQLLADLLNANPPIPYLPRLKVNQYGEKIGEYLLALGGGTRRDSHAQCVDDPLIWGLPGSANHNCAGQALAWPLIVEIVRRVMALPGLAQGLDPETAGVEGLEKRNGFACTSYPFTHRRDWRRAQTSLNVHMRIKPPLRDNADRIRELIRSGSPRIEQFLRASRHVHFAWFELVESDTVLLLHTVYDGPYGAYLQHFATTAGDLFDELFQRIEDPPPMPVDKFPNEFAAHLLRYDRPAGDGLLFQRLPQ